MMRGIAHALHLVDGVRQAHQEALVQIVVYRTAQLVHPRKVPIGLDVVRQIDDLFQQGHIRLAGGVPADGLVNGVLHAEDVTGHDCTKKLDMPEQLALCAQYGIELDELEQKALKLLHSKTGAAIARDVFGVEDAVYDAIWYHTTGKPDMTLLEKIIYLADYIEPSRDFDGVDTLRQAVYEDLDHGLLMGLSMTIQEMEEMGNPVHHLTRDARDYLLKRGIR